MDDPAHPNGERQVLKQEYYDGNKQEMVSEEKEIKIISEMYSVTSRTQYFEHDGKLGKRIINNLDPTKDVNFEISNWQDPRKSDFVDLGHLTHKFTRGVENKEVYLG